MHWRAALLALRRVCEFVGTLVLKYPGGECRAPEQGHDLVPRVRPVRRTFMLHDETQVMVDHDDLLMFPPQARRAAAAVSSRLSQT